MNCPLDRAVLNFDEFYVNLSPGRELWASDAAFHVEFIILLILEHLLWYIVNRVL